MHNDPNSPGRTLSLGNGRKPGSIPLPASFSRRERRAGSLHAIMTMLRPLFGRTRCGRAIALAASALISMAPLSAMANPLSPCLLPGESRENLIERFADEGWQPVPEAELDRAHRALGEILMFTTYFYPPAPDLETYRRYEELMIRTGETRSGGTDLMMRDDDFLSVAWDPTGYGDMVLCVIAGPDLDDVDLSGEPRENPSGSGRMAFLFEMTTVNPPVGPIEIRTEYLSHVPAIDLPEPQPGKEMIVTTVTRRP